MAVRLVAEGAGATPEEDGLGKKREREKESVSGEREKHVSGEEERLIA